MTDKLPLEFLDDNDDSLDRNALTLLRQSHEHFCGRWKKEAKQYIDAFREGFVAWDDDGSQTELDVAVATLAQEEDPKKLEMDANEIKTIVKATVGEWHPSYSACLYFLGLSRLEQGDWRAASNYLDEAVAKLTRIGQQAGVFCLMSRNSLGKAAIELGDYAKAERLLFDTLEPIRSEFGDTHHFYAQALMHLGLLHFKLGRFTDAESMLTSAIEVAHQADDEGGLFEAMTYLSDVRYALGRYEEAFASLQRIKAWSQARGRTRTHALVLQRAAQICEHIGELSEADDMLRESCEIMRDISGEESMDYAYALINFGCLRSLYGDRDSATVVYKKAIRIVETICGESPLLAVVLCNYGTALAAAGDLDQAEALYKRALGIQASTLPDNHPDFVLSINGQGVLLQEKGFPQEAEELLKRALSIAEASSCVSNHRKVATLLNNLAVVYKDFAEYKKSLEHLEMARSIIEQSVGAEHPSIGIIYHNIAAVLHEQAKFESAESFYEKAIRSIQLDQHEWRSRRGIVEANMQLAHNRERGATMLNMTMQAAV